MGVQHSLWLELFFYVYMIYIFFSLWPVIELFRCNLWLMVFSLWSVIFTLFFWWSMMGHKVGICILICDLWFPFSFLCDLGIYFNAICNQTPPSHPPSTLPPLFGTVIIAISVVSGPFFCGLWPMTPPHTNHCNYILNLKFLSFLYSTLFFTRIWLDIITHVHLG